MKEGGSVIRMADDANEEHRYFVGFTGTTYSQTNSSRRHAQILEVDGKGDVQTTVRVHRDFWDLTESGLYRAIPSKSIYGETKDSPFAQHVNMSDAGAGQAGPPNEVNITVESSAHYDPPRTTSISQPKRGSSFSARRPRQAMFVSGR